jgi:hypothetical protein
VAVTTQTTTQPSDVSCNIRILVSWLSDQASWVIACFLVEACLDRLVARWLRERDPKMALSLLPYHAMSEAYEQLSLFFNILMAAGVGGFGFVSDPRLLGQSLLIAKEIYLAAGGHAAVRRFVRRTSI